MTDCKINNGKIRCKKDNNAVLNLVALNTSKESIGYKKTVTSGDTRNSEYLFLV